MGWLRPQHRRVFNILGQRQLSKILKNISLLHFLLQMAYKRPDLAIRLICPDCQDGVPDIREEYASGDLVCGGCGYVLGGKIVDIRPEWRSFTNDDSEADRAEAEADSLMDGVENISLSVDYHSGASVTPHQRIAKGPSARTQRKLILAFQTMETIGARISLPQNIVDLAKGVYKLAHQDKIFKRGECADAAPACCIFIACRKGGVPRLFAEIHPFTNVSKTSIGKCFRVLKKRYDTNAKASTNPLKAAAMVAPRAVVGYEGLLSRLVNHLDLSPHINGTAKKIIDNCQECGVLDDRSPTTIASAAVFITSHLSGIGKSVKEVSMASGASEKSIREALMVMHEEKDVLVPTLEWWTAF